MLPDMSGALMAWAVPVTLRTKTITTVDFEETVVNTDLPIDAVVQPADKEKLNAVQIDWSLQYLQVHSMAEISVGQYIVSGGKEYKVVTAGDYAAYGFSDVTAEEVK